MNTSNGNLAICSGHDISTEVAFDEDDALGGGSWDYEEITLVVEPANDVNVDELQQSSVAVVILSLAVAGLTMACAFAGRL
jgi:hypothetical protein